jgi:DNA-directed RNA polymerase subunit RPC12/RpoP/anti-anti-sigma regulatory factor
VKRLTINKQILPDELRVELIGPIDEDSDFREILGLQQKKMTFDFEQVNMINSCGIREWIKFLEELPATAEISYENCPQIIIEQINMVHGFFKNGAVIKSFYAPYFCESCDKEIKVKLESMQVEGRKAPKLNCPQCGSDGIEFDAIEAQYFSFLERT